jgi:hypothetical protein
VGREGGRENKGYGIKNKGGGGGRSVQNAGGEREGGGA